MNKNVIKAYNIVETEKNEAIIDLYGEVVASHPVDYWTGEPVNGNYIAADEFLKDLDALKEKDSIIVHINSVGGDLYAGVSIYNRLKELDANITTINDGLAASAASLIFMAGDTRKVNSGSNLMIHQASGFLYGYYGVDELEKVGKQLEAANKTAVNIYAEASECDPKKIKKMVDAETWLTGQEAVDAGLADEVIGDDSVAMMLSADKTVMVVNGISLPTTGMRNIPQGIPVMPLQNVSKAGSPAKDKYSMEGVTEMEEIKNIDELRAAYPDMVGEVENAAREAGRQEGTRDERARIRDIEDIQNAIADKALVASAKFGDTGVTASQLALEAMKAQAAVGAATLAAIDADTKASGVDQVVATPTGGPEMDNAVDEAQAVKDVVDAFNMMKNGGK